VTDAALTETARPRAERILETFLFASRWALAPFYVGLVIVLAVLLVKFMQELGSFLWTVFEIKDTDAILGVLTLVDLSLVANLLIMIILAGYENFVSRIDHADHENRPEWMGKVDFGDLKLKLIGSIVAISGIHLLKAFMNAHAHDSVTLAWLVGIHLTFVVSGVLLALMDRLKTH